MKRAISLVILLAIAWLAIPELQAKGRTGSHRVGGHSSHGKGSHYVGGH